MNTMSTKINYYDAFKCTADKCPYTCCQQWDITIDEDTRKKWEGIQLHNKVLCDCIEKIDQDYIMVLNEERKCPFLNANHLCSMVVDLDEKYLSKICMSYPRHITEFEDRQEYALDFGCPAVIDLLQESLDEGVSFVEADSRSEEPSCLEQVRSMVVELLKHTAFSLTERMMMTYYCLLDMLEQEVLTEEMLEEYKSSSYLEELVGEIRKVGIDEVDSLWEKNELFLDRVQLYKREKIYGEHLEAITSLSEQLETSYDDETLEEKLVSFKKQYINYEKLFENYFIAEVWANSLKPEITLEEMVMVYQWVVLEYCTMKHTLCLKWLQDGEQALNYETVRDYMMIVSRMSNDDFREIRETLEENYDSPIFEWGQLALILGK